MPFSIVSRYGPGSPGTCPEARYAITASDVIEVARPNPPASQAPSGFCADFRYSSARPIAASDGGGATLGRAGAASPWGRSWAPAASGRSSASARATIETNLLQGGRVMRVMIPREERVEGSVNVPGRACDGGSRRLRAMSTARCMNATDRRMPSSQEANTTMVAMRKKFPIQAGSTRTAPVVIEKLAAAAPRKTSVPTRSENHIQALA